MQIVRIYVAENSYFAKKKNQRGYQLAAAFSGGHSETVTMFLDSGNTHCTDHYDDLLNAILSKFQDQIYNGSLILKTDSGFGSSENVEKLLSIHIGGNGNFPKIKSEVKNDC